MARLTPPSLECAPTNGTREKEMHGAAVKERFRAWADSPAFAHLRPWLAHLQDAVLDRIDWRASERVLDVGCGLGRAVLHAAERLPEGGLAAGCDVSFGMLKAGRTGEARPRVVAARAESLPFDEAAFDAVLVTAAFHHFAPPLRALAEIRRVLKPGGRLVIADACRDLSLATWLWDRVHRWFEKGHVEYYRTADLESLLDRAGFSDVRLEIHEPSYREVRKFVRRAAIFTACPEG